MRIPIIALAATLTLGAGILASEVDDAPDPWLGKSRDEVVHALGKPTKERSTRGDGARLVYRLHRLVEGAVPGPRMTVVEVAGVGTLVRVLPASRDDPRFDPTRLDGRGVLRPGGTVEDEGRSVTYDPDTRSFERDWDPDDVVEVAGKVTIRFDLDARGRVVDWSVSPKSARRDRREE